MASNIPTAQVLAFKRVLRYMSKLDQHDRFVADVRFHIQHTARKRVGKNIFHFWEDVLNSNKLDGENLEQVSDIYALFKQELIADLAQSARIQRNGLDTLVQDTIKWMYRASPIPVPTDIAGICDQICLPETSFIMKPLKASDGTRYLVPHVHNYPSWQIKGSFVVVQ